MNQVSMTSMQRVLTTLGHREPDRVPFFLLLSLHGAKELGVSIKAYFSKPENVVEGQMRLLKKYRHDCVYGFFYAPVEIEAFGGEVVFSDDGPPNSGDTDPSGYQKPGCAGYRKHPVPGPGTGRHPVTQGPCPGAGAHHRGGDVSVLPAGHADGVQPVPGSDV
jgi:hypothetical protein